MSKFFRFLQYALLLGLIGFSGYFIYQDTRSPCSKTIEYDIGRLDREFGLSREEFKDDITVAEKVWEKALDRNEFAYKPGAAFKVNLIYDERQIATVQKQKTEFGLSAVEEAFKNLDSQFSLFKKQYDQKVAAYESSLSAYQNRKEDYEAEVAKWNARGGAPKDEYESLEEERQVLNAEAERLNLETNAINEMAGELNALLKQRNIKAEEYNKLAEQYNKKYGQGLEFNQAEYNGKGINVYQFANRQDLVLALTHEFGHALGMDHVDNPDSVMYYLSGPASSQPTLSSEDISELERVCEI